MLAVVVVVVAEVDDLVDEVEASEDDCNLVLVVLGVVSA